MNVRRDLDGGHPPPIEAPRNYTQARAINALATSPALMADVVGEQGDGQAAAEGDEVGDLVMVGLQLVLPALC
jgi:hypothetical protein